MHDKEKREDREPEETDRNQQRHDPGDAESESNGIALIEPFLCRRPHQAHQSEHGEQREADEQDVGGGPGEQTHRRFEVGVHEGVEARPLVDDAPDGATFRSRKESEVLFDAARIEECGKKTKTERRSETSGASTLRKRVTETPAQENPGQRSRDEQGAHHEGRVHVGPYGEKEHGRRYSEPGRKLRQEEHPAEQERRHQAEEFRPKLDDPVPREHQEDRGSETSGCDATRLAPEQGERE